MFVCRGVNHFRLALKTLVGRSSLVLRYDRVTFLPLASRVPSLLKRLADPLFALNIEVTPLLLTVRQVRAHINQRIRADLTLLQLVHRLSRSVYFLLTVHPVTLSLSIYQFNFLPGSYLALTGHRLHNLLMLLDRRRPLTKIVNTESRLRRLLIVVSTSTVGSWCA